MNGAWRHAEELLAAARHLEVLASELATLTRSITARASTEWQGPHAQRFAADVHRWQARHRQAAEDLRQTAAAYRRQAARLTGEPDGPGLP